MADWSGSSISNYFKVKDVEKSKKLCSLWGVDFIRDTEYTKSLSEKSKNVNKIDSSASKYGSFNFINRRYLQISVNIE